MQLDSNSPTTCKGCDSPDEKRCQIPPTCIGSGHYSRLPIEAHGAGLWIPASSPLKAHDQRQQRGGNSPQRVTEDIEQNHFNCLSWERLRTEREGESRSWSASSQRRWDSNVFTRLPVVELWFKRFQTEGSASLRAKVSRTEVILDYG